jgi:hypothetical protein
MESEATQPKELSAKPIMLLVIEEVTAPGCLDIRIQIVLST